MTELEEGSNVGITNCRYQHTVGQGGFHTGSIYDDETLRLSYVYDCGAMHSYAVARGREVRRFRQRAGTTRPLDILFLSHVHADHVNGVEQLLQSVPKLEVDTIVLPLMNVVERLIAFGRTATEDPASAQSPFYQSFVVDPGGALRRFEPRQILFVEESREGGAPGGDDDPDLGFPDGPSVAGRHEGERTPSWKLVGRGSVRHVSAEISPAQTSSAHIGARKSHTSEYIIPSTTALAVTSDSAAWLLAPYVDPLVVSDQKKFLAQLALECGIKHSVIEAWLSNTANVADLVTNGVHHLAAAYAAVAKDLNISSMCLYSGPARATTLGLPRLAEARLGRIRARSHRPGWLGTGDAALKQAGRRKAMLKHYGQLLDEVNTLVLPHHGSDHNFHRQLLDVIRPGACVAAAERYSTWKHPGPHTVQAVCSAAAVIHVVTSARRSRVRERATLG